MLFFFLLIHNKACQTDSVAQERGVLHVEENSFEKSFHP